MKLGDMRNIIEQMRLNAPFGARCFLTFRKMGADYGDNPSS